MRFEGRWVYGFIAILFMSAWIVGLAPAQEAGEEAPAEEQIVGDPKAGEKLVETLDCRQCHTIHGDGGEVGPDLSNIGLRRSQDWLVRWLEDPTLFRPSSGMPGFTWKSEQEIYDI
ncbi:MAG: cytochrome c, partial [Deltaproteobacteria bacterium]|nr:cytochrome c [Deltaproteobacteria bacterium]